MTAANGPPLLELLAEMTQHASFSVEDLAANFKEFMSTLVKMKPSTAKGVYIKGVSLSTTMGPGIKVAYSV